MRTIHVTAKDMFKPRYGIAPQAWVGLVMYKMRLQDRELVQVQSMEWPSGYVGFESITPRLRFARWLYRNGRISEQ